MYCKKCGNWLPDNVGFCSFCGEKVEEAAAGAATAAPVTTAPPVPESIPYTEMEKGKKQEKYYTSKHIVLCLVVAGIMAAAGVFAGLYFSVI